MADPIAVDAVERAPIAAMTLEVPDSVAAWSREIERAAARHGLEPDWVALIVWLESRGVADARSSAGALGLMQLMPGTATVVARRRGQPAPTDAQLLDPEHNLDLGCALVAELADELAPEGPDADAVYRVAIAYNGGPRVLERWRRGEPLPEETARYAAAMRERWASYSSSL